MEEANSILNRGVMQQLDSLEARATELARRQLSAQRKDHDLRDAYAEVLRLRRRRDALRNELARRPSKILADVVKSPTTKIPRDPIIEQKQAVLRAKTIKLQSMMHLYSLAGITAQPIWEKGTVIFTLGTAFGGEYYESYYVEVKKQDPPRLLRHSFPQFVPLKELTEKHLAKNLQHFIWVLGDYLNAFVARREQVERTKSKFSDMLVGSFSHNAAITTMHFKYRFTFEEQNFVVAARLEYSSLLRVLPGTVTLSLKGVPDISSNLEMILEKQEQEFKSKLLFEAFGNI
ncbi:centromere protein O [Lethenteron reissneri]|uniref:centromere protein O n=1 Tax=Lethenteron reissneri TaxID=7753 RepID=UPI002AB72698|nr:centromere protein O [Lethenteron reissneri]XP_061415904.1 centromere protein O [Lethenteron reissneri]